MKIRIYPYKWYWMLEVTFKHKWWFIKDALHSKKE